MNFSKTILIALLFLTKGLGFVCAESRPELLKALQVPEGFKVSIYADNLPNARSMALGENGIVFVGTGSAGNVYAVQDINNDGVADLTFTLAKDLDMPNGVAFKDGSLYVAEIKRIIRFDNIIQALNKPPTAKVVYDQFPTDRHHGWKYLRFGPDGKLYTAIGAPCNVCNPDKPYASLVKLNPDGSGFEVIASGIRNSVGFDWQPETNDLFFNDNGRDHLGDDLPPEELNKWTKPGEHFGFPFCHAGSILDPEFGVGKNCRDYVPPVWKYKAHIAPLGLRFYRGTQFPSTYKNQLLVAQHGSWNRTKPDGYRIALVKFKNGKAVSEEIFMDGWLTNLNNVLGRPADILEIPDGSLLISDDQLGLIYKIAYQGKP